jgi:hypothetical protein
MRGQDVKGLAVPARLYHTTYHVVQLTRLAHVPRLCRLSSLLPRRALTLLDADTAMHDNDKHPHSNRRGSGGQLHAPRFSAWTRATGSGCCKASRGGG